MSTRTISARLALDGETEFKRAMTSVNGELRTLKSELTLAEAEFKGQANTMEFLSRKNDILSKEYTQQEEKIRALESALRDSISVYGDTDSKTDAYRQQLNRAKAELIGLNDALEENGRYLEEAEKSTNGCAQSIDEYGKRVERAEEKTTNFAGKLRGIGTAGAAAFTAISAAASAVAAAAVKGVTDIAEYGDNIDKMSQKLGMSAEAYQEWDAVMQHSGTSIESMQSSMKTLASAAETGNAAFEALGLSQKEISEMDQEELFGATISALQDLDDETQRTYLAGKLLGRGATELGPLLNTSAEDTQAMKDRLHELGGVMSNEAVKAAAAFQDSLQDLNTGLSGAKNLLMSDFLPSVTTIMDGLTEIFAGSTENGLTLLEDGLSSFTGELSAKLPQVLELGTGLLEGISKAIIDNLPELVGPTAQIIGQLANGLVEQLPELASAGVEIINSLAENIAAAIPELIPTVVNVALQIAETLIDNVDLLVDAAIEIILALSDGLINATPELLEKAPVIIGKLASAIAENGPKILRAGGELIGNLIMGILGAVPELVNSLPEVLNAIETALLAGWNLMVDAGMYLLEGLWAGVSEKIGWVKEKFSGLIDTIKSIFTGPKGFDEHSPSKWSEQVASYLMEGLAIGMENSKGQVMETADDIVAEIKNRFNGLSAVFEGRQDVGELQYKLWERTYGQDASEAEKYQKQLELLGGQQADQEAIVRAAEEAYKAVAEQYGENSAESLSYQKTLLEEELKYYDLEDSIRSVIAAMAELQSMGGIPSNAELAAGLDTNAMREPVPATAQDVRSMGAAVVNGMQTASVGRGSGDLTVNMKINGKTLYSETIEDFRAVNRANPEVVDDK